MSACNKVARPITRCLRQSQPIGNGVNSIRSFSTTLKAGEEAVVETASTKRVVDPETAITRRDERLLMKQGVMPAGSRRRRAALRGSDNVPFEQLPYQCFQEARKVLQADREEKLAAIAKERKRISHLVGTDAQYIKGGETQKQFRLDSMRRHLEDLKILADINDPLIKKRFEDGEGDMNKPIYRYLADKKWRSYQYKLIVQRINQLNLVPDVLPHFEPVADVRMAFKRRTVHPGEFVDSRVSEIPARLNVQVFDKGERLVSVVVLDSDVPHPERDSFTSRCHFLATNILISPSETSVPLSKVAQDTQMVLPWLPPHAQKGSPYHRLSVFILQQPEGKTLDAAELKSKVVRDSFSLRSFADKYNVKPVGATIFRAEWDEGTAGVMERHGLEGADVEFKRQRIAALKPKQKPRGWEARHASDKYKSLRR